MFHYYDHTHPLLPYAYSLPGELSDGEYAPDYTIPVQPEKRTGYWPVANSTRTGWDYIEDHRQHMDSKGTKQGGTPYWQPAEGDDWQSPPRYTEELGPLPDGAVTERPAKPPAHCSHRLSGHAGLSPDGRGQGHGQHISSSPA